MRAALKVVSPILLCWPMTPEADVGGVAIEIEPFCHLSDSNNMKWNFNGEVITPTSASDVVGQRNKIEGIIFEASLFNNTEQR